MKIILSAVAVVVLLVAVALIVLSAVEIPAPSRPIEKTIPADRLPH